jgi:hypothetical protein
LPSRPLLLPLTMSLPKRVFGVIPLVLTSNRAKESTAGEALAVDGRCHVVPVLIRDGAAGRWAGSSISTPPASRSPVALRGTQPTHEEAMGERARRDAMAHSHCGLTRGYVPGTPNGEKAGGGQGTARGGGSPPAVIPPSPSAIRLPEAPHFMQNPSGNGAMPARLELRWAYTRLGGTRRPLRSGPSGKRTPSKMRRATGIEVSPPRPRRQPAACQMCNTSPGLAQPWTPAASCEW